MCGRTEECVGGLENKLVDWRMCGRTGECVGGLENVWEDWRISW